MSNKNISLAGEKIKAAGYHNINTGIQTFEFNFSNWSGSLEIQGTLAVDPTESDWFKLKLTTPTNSNILVEFDNDSTDYDSSIYANCTGNFVWIRAVIATNSGSVNYIHYNY